MHCTIPACLIWLVLLAGCTTPTQVISTDLTRQSGVYVIGYVDRDTIRRKLEDRFVADLAEHDIRGVASSADFEYVKRASTTQMVRAANSHDVVAIVIINRVAGDGSGSIIDSDQRIAPSDLTAYLEVTRTEADDYGDEEPIFAEVNAFLVDGSQTRRFWTGTTWTYQGEDDEVIGNVSQTIAAKLAEVATELRTYDRPMN